MSPAMKNPESKLSGAVKIAAVVFVFCLGLYGCARQPAAKNATPSDRLRAAEARCQKLEQDYRAVAAARDKARADLRAVQEGRAALLREKETLRTQVKRSQDDGEGLRRALVQRTGERDDLRHQVTLRLNERDALQGRCDKLRKGLQGLLTQDDQQSHGAVVPVVGPTAPTLAPGVGGNS